jgi:hypothetical protein
MFGGGALLAVMALVSVLDRRTWWSYPNLLAAHFYGQRVIGGGLGWPTVSGIAFQLLIAACAGALFGGLFGGVGGSGRIALLAITWGLLVFYASEQFYRIASAFIIVYLPRTALMMAHLTYGACLAGIRRIGSQPQPPAALAVLEPGVPETSRERASIPEALNKDADSTGQESTL